MKKVASLLLLAGVAAFGLVGCGDDVEVTGPQPEITSVQVTPSSVSLEPGQTATVSADVTTQGDVGTLSFSWSTGNSSVASVSGSGSTATVTGQADGTTSVTVSVSAANVSGAQTASTGVEVQGIQPVINSVSVTPSEVQVKEGSSTTLTADFDVSSTVEGLALSFSSADASVAEVTSTSDNDGDGVDEVATVTGNATGTVAITVTASADNASSKSTSSSVEVVEQIQEEAEVSITIPGGTTVSGEFDANVTVNPGTETVTEVRLLVDGEVVDSEQFSSSSDIQPQTNEQGVVTQAAPSTITFSVASAAFNALTGENQFDNGERTLSAELDTEERGSAAVTASRSVTFDNESGWVLYLETQIPESRDGDLLASDVEADDTNGSGDVDPGDRNPAAQGAAGFRWTTGHLYMVGVPVIYEPNRSIRNANFKFQEQSGSDVAASGAISSSEDVTDIIERLTGETVGQTVMGFQTMFDGATGQVANYTTEDPDFPDQPVVRSVDNSGNTGPSDLLAVLPGFFPSPDFIFSDGQGNDPENIGINLDNEQASAELLAVNPPGQMQWINEDYDFNTNFTVPTDPPGHGSVTGGVNFNQHTFYVAQSGGECPEGFVELEGPTGQEILDHPDGGMTATNDAYVACARWWDKFANEDSRASLPFGLDPIDPEITVDDGNTIADGDMFGPGEPLNPLGTTIAFGITDQGAVSSGFSSTPLRVTAERQVGTGTGGSPQFLCLTENNVVNGYGGGVGDGSGFATSKVVCSKSIPGTDPGPNNGSDKRDTTVEIPADGGAGGANDDGYYSVDAFVRDKAANRSGNATVRWVIDETPPTVSGVDFDVPLQGGVDEQFVLDGADNVDLIWSTMFFIHASHPMVLHPHTGASGMAAIQDDALGVKFDGETAFQESLMLGTTQIAMVFEDFLRGLQLMDGSDQPTTTIEEFTGVQGAVYDAGPWNCTGQAIPVWANLTGNCDFNSFTFDAANIETPTAYDTGDFIDWAVTSVTQDPATISISGEGTADLEATVRFDDADDFGASLPWKTANGGKVRFHWKVAGLAGAPWHEIKQQPQVVTTLGDPNEVRWSITWNPDARVSGEDMIGSGSAELEIRAVAQNASGDAAVTQTFTTTVSVEP